MSTKDLIKENAIILFGEYGYKGTAINDIVNAVGIKKGSFYGHYSSKEELFLEILKQEFSEFIRCVENCNALNHNKPVIEKLFLIFKSEIEYLNRNKAVSKFLMRFTFFPGADIETIIDSDLEIQAMKEKINYFNRTIFDDAIKEEKVKCVDIDELVESFYWLVNTTVIKSIFYNKDYNEENINNIWYYYINGVKKN